MGAAEVACCGQWDTFGCFPGASHPASPQQATSAAPMIQAWWRRWPEANIGLVTGEASGLVVLDVDPRHGGEVALEELERRFGELPSTVQANTGGGGRHLVFRHPGIRVPNSAGLLGPGLDMRGDGGYIVAPPSLHASGHRYVWDGAHPLTALEPAPIPGWLLERLKTGSRNPSPQGPRCPLGALALWGVKEGQRNASLTRLAGHLLRHRVDPDISLGLLKSWNDANCTPPLTESEMVRTLESIASLELRRRRGRL